MAEYDLYVKSILIIMVLRMEYILSFETFFFFYIVWIPQIDIEVNRSL